MYDSIRRKAWCPLVDQFKFTITTVLQISCLQHRVPMRCEPLTLVAIADYNPYVALASGSF